MVCQRHFLSEEIVWGRDAKDANGRVIRVSIYIYIYIYKYIYFSVNNVSGIQIYIYIYIVTLYFLYPVVN